MGKNQGISSKNVVRSNVKTGSGSRGTHPGGVAQLGQHVGDKATHAKATGYRGEPLHNNRSFQPVPFGNEVALNVKGGGPGKGYTVYKTGSQDQHGPVAGQRRPQGRDILNNE